MHIKPDRPIVRGPFVNKRHLLKGMFLEMYDRFIEVFDDLEDRRRRKRRSWLKYASRPRNGERRR